MIRAAGAAFGIVGQEAVGSAGTEAVAVGGCHTFTVSNR
eukprot:SAG22_NODE_7988_length_693_cov_0.858586_1_plen_38_part_10